MVEISPEDMHWKGKLLVFTWHFKEEFDRLRKPLEFVLEVLEEGEHVLISKNQNKHNVFHRFRGRYICLSYVEDENVILIHIKPISRRPGGKSK